MIAANHAVAGSRLCAATPRVAARPGHEGSSALSVSRVHVVHHDLHAYAADAIAGCGFGCRESASTISDANTQSAPAMKNAGR